MALVSDWVDVEVSYKQFWTDTTWTVEPKLVALALRMGLGNQMDQAQLLWRGGEMFSPGDVGPNLFKANPSPLGLQYYVRLRRVNAPLLDWVGYVTREDLSMSGRFVENNQSYFKYTDNVIHAIGMEYFLDRQAISSAVHFDGNRINRPLGFNMGSGTDRGTPYEVRGNRDTRLDSNNVYGFATSDQNRGIWDGEQVVQHLLQYHQPNDDAGNNRPCDFFFNAGLYGSLVRWCDPIMETEHRTVFALLNELINPRRALVWWLTYDEGNNRMDVRLNTTTEAAVALPGGRTIPAAQNQQSLNFDDQVKVKRASVNQNADRLYDRIKVRGARRTATFTVSQKDATLEAGWVATFEDQYKQANGETTPEKADRFRRKEKYKPIYQEYIIPLAWDGKAGDGGGAAPKNFVCPVLSSTGSVLGAETLEVTNLRLMRQLPLREGWDYDDAANPVPGGRVASSSPDFMRPFGIVEHGNKWCPLDRSSGHRDEDDSATSRLETSYNLIMSEGVPGFEVSASARMPHAIAKGTFDTGGPAPSDTNAEIDWRECRFTVCGEWDAYCEAIEPADPLAIRTGDPLQELVISLGDRARWDYLVSGTVFDIADNGTSVKSVTTGGSIRDDRELCEITAKAAHAWYKTPRRTYGVVYAEFVLPLNVGDFTTLLGPAVSVTPGDQIPVNCTVSQVQIEFENGMVSLAGGFQELDFRALL